MEDLAGAEEECIDWFICALGRSDKVRLRRIRSLGRYWLNDWVVIGVIGSLGRLHVELIMQGWVIVTTFSIFI